MKQSLPVVAALGAAMINASVGVISKGVLDAGVPSVAIAFWKCLMALIVLTVLVGVLHDHRNTWAYLRRHSGALALCAACGFFGLYTFETAAYAHANVSTVVFVLFGASTLTTFVLNAVLARTPLTKGAVWSLSLALAGLLLIFRREVAVFENLYNEALTSDA